MERGNSSGSIQGPPNAVRVRVYRISAVTDPETGKPGKSIELVQVKQQRQQSYLAGPFGGGDQDMVKNILSQFQSMGLPIGPNPVGSPKLNLFLSESEYDLLGVRFEVNEVYDMILKDGTIRFSKPSDGI